MKTYYIETKDSKGHTSFYRDVLLKTECDYELIASQELVRGLEHNVLVKSKCLWRNTRFNGKITNRIEQVYLTLKALNYADNNGHITFLAYDTIVLAIVLLIKRSNFSMSVFEHNNIDECDASFIKRICYRFLSKKVKSFVFERYIGEHIHKEYNRKFEVIQHRKFKFSKIKYSSPLQKYIFMPSREVSEKGFKVILRFARNEGLLLVCKNYHFLNGNFYPNVEVSNHFEDYEELMVNANYVAIPNEFRHRISGVFYEAIGNKKQILMTDSLFSHEMAKIYDTAEVIY